MDSNVSYKVDQSGRKCGCCVHEQVIIGGTSRHPAYAWVGPVHFVCREHRKDGKYNG